MDKRIPVTILTGFLGSGKTTLLNYILTQNHGKKIAVIENEFGEIGIDNEIVVNAEEEIFEMNNGCICCTVRGDLIRILGKLSKKKEKFDYVIIETTGLADPAPVAQTFFVDDDIKRDFRLDGIVTLIDSKHFSQHIETDKECLEQIAFADVILLNKTDLVSSLELIVIENKVKAINNQAKMFQTKNANIDINAILEVGGFNFDRAMEIKPTFLEKEYPFEWIGFTELNKGDYEIKLKEGPDNSLKLGFKLFAKEVNIETLEDHFSTIMSERPAPSMSSHILLPNNELINLDLSKGNDFLLKMNIHEKSFFALSSQHHPDEFSLVLASSDQNEIKFPLQKNYSGGHEHDNEITSVGIEAEGELDPEKFDKWIG